MEPYRYKKKLLMSGTSKYSIIPATWKYHKVKEVIIEVYEDKIVIRPLKK